MLDNQSQNGMDTEANQKWARNRSVNCWETTPLQQVLRGGYARKYLLGPAASPWACKVSYKIIDLSDVLPSSCPNPPADCSGALDNPGPNSHVLFGALAAGPAENGDYTDDRKDITHNGVSCTYNAAFTGALAALVEIS
ncbi:Endoglucanase-like [Homarus americanus]|uniref:cellulase n=1 Tax=Homarus americanus TaxID=6706 RepID=A0A8J5KF56_HOMAM|nr:Endoglucanase-like [Homarus americanus]